MVDNYTSTILNRSAYQIPIACLYIIPVFLSVALLWLPESPRWLLHRGKDAEARAALERLRPTSATSESIELEWAEMLRGVEEEQNHAKTVGVLDMFRGMWAARPCVRPRCQLSDYRCRSPEDAALLWNDRLPDGLR